MTQGAPTSGLFARMGQQVLHTFGERDESGAYLLAVFEAPDGKRWSAKYVVERLSAPLSETRQGDLEFRETVTIHVEFDAIPAGRSPMGDDTVVTLPTWCDREWSVSNDLSEYQRPMVKLVLVRRPLVRRQPLDHGGRKQG